jgi:hypothetical protein
MSKNNGTTRQRRRSVQSAEEEEMMNNNHGWKQSNATRVAVAFVALFLVATSSVLAGVSVDESRVLDRWRLRIGGYLTGLDTELRLDSTIEDLGTTIKLEDLGFSSSETVPRLNLAFIIGKRHQISAGWYKTDRDSSTTLTEEIEWGDETFPINADIGAFYNTEFFDLAYTYWFYSSEKTALGVTGGLVMTNLSAGLGVRTLGQEIEISEDISSDVPVPQLGFSVNHYLGRRFVLTGILGYIAFGLDDWEGDVAGAFVGVEHRTWENFGFGAGYGYTAYDVDATAADFLGKFKYTLDGFEIYMRAAW